MNTPEPYGTEPEAPVAHAPSAQMALPPLAVHGDLSRPDPQPASALPTSTAHAQVAWERPSEIPTLVGRELLGRAVELQSAFARGSWRAPARVVRTVRERIPLRDAPDPDFEVSRRQPVTPVNGDGLDPMDPILDGPETEGATLA